jgi:CPA1 family monovalent cation:H+ antiporter
MEHSIAVQAGTFTVLLGAALAISIGAERVRVPAAVALVAFGVVAGTLWHVALPFAFGPALLFVFLPPLVFEAAWNLDLRELTRHALRVTMLAGPGTAFAAFALAAVVSAAGVLPFAPALVLGAIVSATDPIAVVAVFRAAGVPPGLRTLVEAESLANDGVAVVLYGVAVTIAMGGVVSWAGATAGAVVAVAGGIAVGAACAVPMWLAVSFADASEYEVAATVALAYAAYLISDALNCSGIFATAAAAIALRALLTRRPHLTNRNDVDVFWNAAAYMTNAVLFLATGLLIVPQRVLHEPLLVALTLLVVLAARAVMASFVVRDARGRVTVFLAGMRGALPLALALALPQELSARPQIVDAVFATVLVTLVVQGIPLKHLAARLYGSAREPEDALPGRTAQ